ncbi:hypothetical protein D3C75_1139940 [compost metagenome]
MTGSTAGKGVKPIPIQEVEQWNVADHQQCHRQKLLKRFIKQIIQFGRYHTHIGQLGDNGHQGGFQCSILLAGGKRIAPFLKYTVVDPAFEALESQTEIGVNQLGFG